MGAIEAHAVNGAGEWPLFFEGRSARLFGHVHVPAFPCGEVFVFCHPFGEEKLWAHRVFVHMARELCARGFHVLRYDETGHGDSGGRFADTDWRSRLDDLDAAVALAREIAGAEARCSLLGLRLGATLALACAAERVDVSRVVAWEPIIEGARLARDLIMRNLSSQMASAGRVQETRESLIERMREGEPLNCDGYEVNLRLYEALAELDPRRATPPSVPVLLVSVLASEKQQPKPPLLELAEHLPAGTLETVVEQPFWREVKAYYGRSESLETITLDWLEADRR